MQFSGPFGGHDQPSLDEIAEWMRRTTPPRNEIPAVVTWAAAIGRADGVVVALTGVHVYTSGALLDVAVRLRDATMGHAPPVLGFPIGGADGPDALLVGVELADGRVAAAGAGPPAPPGPASRGTQPSLQMSTGTADDHGADLSFFLSPLPPAGPLAVYCVWPGRGIPETRTVFDATSLVTAREGVEVLWEPEIPSPPSPPSPGPSPDLPPDSWFGRVLRPPTHEP
jgi:hypothetical protein